MIRVVAAGLLAAALVAPTAARAQDDDVGARLREAYELRERGEHEAARVLLAGVHDETRSPKALAMLALAEHALDRWGDVYAHMAEALESDNEWVERHRAELEGVLGDARTHIALLRVEGADGLSVTVDGVDRGTLPLPRPLALAPGAHELRLEASDGREAHRAARTVAAGEDWVVRAPTGGTPSTVPEAAPSAGVDAAPWVLVGISAAVLAAGAVLLAIGRVDADAIENAPVGTVWADVSDDADRALVLINSGIVALAVGGVGLVASLVWALAGGGGDDARADAPGVIRF